MSDDMEHVALVGYNVSDSDSDDINEDSWLFSVVQMEGKLDL